MKTYNNPFSLHVFSKGLTLIELMVVIIMVGLLASISIGAFNGLPNRAKTVQAQNSADTVKKRAEKYNALVGSYPTAFAATDGFSTASPSDSTVSLKGTGILLAAITTAPTDANSPTVEYLPCTTPAGSGARISYWDYTTATEIMTNIGACTTLSGTALSSTNKL